MRYLCNWSGGASSILATKIALENFGADNCDIVFAETNSHLPFMKELFERSQAWYNKEITVLNSGQKLEDLVRKYGHYENVRMNNFCTRILKQDLIKKHCKEHYPDGDYTDVLGYDYSAKEAKRAAKFILFKGKGCFPLIELHIDKIKTLEILEKNGFNLKEHYKNEKHNNCVPCIKAGKFHWNYIKKYHPEKFNEWYNIELKLKETGKANKLEFFKNNGEPKEFEIECNGFFCTVDDFGDLITDDYNFIKDTFQGLKYNQ